MNNPEKYGLLRERHILLGIALAANDVVKALEGLESMTPAAKAKLDLLGVRITNARVCEWENRENQGWPDDDGTILHRKFYPECMDELNLCSSSE